MNKLLSSFRNRLSERGDVVQTVLMLPVAFVIFFAMINLSSYFSVRSEVQDAARNGVRLVALYGGNSTAAIKNNTGKTVNSIVLSNIAPGGECSFSYCYSPPKVTCTPNVVTNAGDPVQCSINYRYSPLAPVWGANGKAGQAMRGLNGDFGAMTVTASSVSETGTQG